jgi:ketosteroid isomerase-like protein
MRNRLAVFLLLSAVLLLGGCTMWREHAVSKWTDATGGEGLERSFWKEVQAKNWTELGRHVTGNYVSFTPEEGRLDRAAAIEHLRKLQLEEFSLGDFLVELNGQTLVVTYTITMRGTFEGQPVPTSPVRMMTVWQQQKAGWLAIAHSVVGPERKE